MYLTSVPGAVSFKQTGRTSEALSVKKTRQNPIRSASNLNRGSNLAVLSPPREEPGSENQETSTSRQITPLKSSLKSGSKNSTDSQKASGPTNHENVPPTSKGDDPTGQSLCVSSVSTRPLESTISDNRATPAKQVATPTAEKDKSTHGDKAYSPRRRGHSRTTTRIPKPTSQDGLDVAPGKNLKPTFSCDLDSMTAYAVVPGAKILSGTSTMRYQPKTSHTDSTAELANVGSSSRSLKSTYEKEDNQPERLTTGPKHTVTPDQMDGAVDIVLSGNLCRGSFRDLKDQFEGRQTAMNRPSSYPIWKSRSSAHLLRPNDVKFQDQKQSLIAPRKGSPISVISSRGDLKRGSGKVMDLAAKFDSAVKASPFIPVEDCVEHKNRRETAGLVSPYTSNPSPLQSVTSTSTPASLMCQSRDTVSLPSATVDSARKSGIPRSQHVDSGGKAEREARPATARAESGYSLGKVRSPLIQSKLLTPTSSPTKKKASCAGSVSLAQLDGSSKIPRPHPILASRHDVRPATYYSSPILPTTTCAGESGVSSLSQHSITSAYSETQNYSQDVSSPNLSFSPSRGLGRGRNASSLRDQIRGLRQELSSKNEEYAKLRLEFEEKRKASQVNEILLREDLDRAKADLAKWKRRAERAENKVESFERMATRAHEIRAQSGGRSHDFSFVSGLPDDIDIGERSLQYQPLSARMNQSARRAPENIRPAGTSVLMGGDAMSDCSGSTVVRNTHGGEEGHWASVDEMVEIAGPGFMDDLL